MQVLDILTTAYRYAGALLGPGRGLSGSEQAEGLSLLNSHLNGLRIERCFIYQMIRTEPLQVVANKQDYIVGPAPRLAQYGVVPDWDVSRYGSDTPNRLYGAGFLVPGTPSSLTSEVPMTMLLDYSQWKNIVTKSTTASQPRVIYYRCGQNSNNPLAGTASLWPLPYQDSQLVIYIPGLVQGFSDVTQDVLWPDGYQEFLENSLAIRVNAVYPRAVMKPQVPEMARFARARVMANQLTPLYIQSDSGASGRIDWRSSGWYDARTWPGGWQ